MKIRTLMLATAIAIMATGYAFAQNTSNPPEPAGSKASDSSSSAFTPTRRNFAYWHLTANPGYEPNVRYWGVKPTCAGYRQMSATHYKFYYAAAVLEALLAIS
jgi:hypothetical protein